MTPSEQQASALESGRCANCAGVRNDTVAIRDDIGILRTGQVEIERNVDTVRLTVRVLRENDLPVIRAAWTSSATTLTHLRAGQAEDPGAAGRHRPPPGRVSRKRRSLVDGQRPQQGVGHYYEQHV